MNVARGRSGKSNPGLSTGCSVIHVPLFNSWRYSCAHLEKTFLTFWAISCPLSIFWNVDPLSWIILCPAVKRFHLAGFSSPAVAIDQLPWRPAGMVGNLSPRPGPWVAPPGNALFRHLADLSDERREGLVHLGRPAGST